MQSFAVAALALVGSVAALPNNYQPHTTTAHTTTTTHSSASPTATLNSFSYDATFDDIEAVTPVVSGATQFINTYDSLFFQAFTLAATNNVNTVGLIPNSEANYATFGTQSEASQGTAELTVDYVGSTIEYFHLDSFYYGCAVVSEESAAGVLTACTITIEGYNQAGNVVAGPQTFTFDPTGLSSQMDLAVVESAFQNEELYDVTFAVAGTALAGLTTDVTAGVIDTVKYTVL